jgi:5S rRNA maturation endonuclease (ribonuclease M5)
VACCPAHEDKHPSLKVREGDDRLLVHCHAGCSQDDVLAALGLSWKDVVYERSDDDEPEAVYRYEDEGGKPLFEVVRMPGKRFLQRTPEGEWGRNGARRVLYHLPEVRYAIDQEKTVYVVEGERDAESLRKLGKVATTNPGGAGAWRYEYAEELRGGNVIVIADKDEAGLSHAIGVSRSLEGLARRKMLVQALEGKDVTEHLGRGHAIEELVRIDQAGIPRFFKPMNLFQPVPPVAWVCQNIVVRGEATLLAAEGGAGKSLLALGLSLAVAGGEAFLDQETEQGRVLYVDEEGSPDLALQRLAELGANDTQRRNLDYLNYAGVDVVNGADKLISDVELIQPVLVVLDSHSRVARHADENSNDQMSRAWDEGILRVARTTRAALLVIHHTSSYGRTRGATAISNSADLVLRLERLMDGSRVLSPSKPRRETKQLQYNFHRPPTGASFFSPVYDYTEHWEWE